MKDNIDHLEYGRIKEGRFGSTAEIGRNGAFYLHLKTKKGSAKVLVIVSDEGGWEHVSVTRDTNAHLPPTWDMMCQIRDLFWDENEVVMQLHPRKGDYINNHPGCLHLWKPSNTALFPIPTPPKWMVGVG